MEGPDVGIAAPPKSELTGRASLAERDRDSGREELIARIRGLPEHLRHRIAAAAEALHLLEPLFYGRVDCRLLARKQRQVASLGRVQRSLAHTLPLRAVLDTNTMLAIGRLEACLEWLLASRSIVSLHIAEGHAPSVLSLRQARLLGEVLGAHPEASPAVRALRIESQKLGQEFDTSILRPFRHLRLLSLLYFSACDFAALPLGLEAVSLVLPGSAFIGAQMLVAIKEVVEAGLLPQPQQQPAAAAAAAAGQGGGAGAGAAGAVGPAAAPAQAAQQQQQEEQGGGAAPGAQQQQQEEQGGGAAPGAQQPQQQQQQGGAGPGQQPGGFAPPQLPPEVEAQLVVFQEQLFHAVANQGVLRPIVRPPASPLKQLSIDGGGMDLEVDAGVLLGSPIYALNIHAHMLRLVLPADELGERVQLHRPWWRLWQGLPQESLQAAAARRMQGLLRVFLAGGIRGARLVTAHIEFRARGAEPLAVAPPLPGQAQQAQQQAGQPLVQTFGQLVRLRHDARLPGVGVRWHWVDRGASVGTMLLRRMAPEEWEASGALQRLAGVALLVALAAVLLGRT